MHSSARYVRSLRIRFVVALSLVGLLSISAFGVLSGLIASQTTDGPTINVSGRQRMLSQRIAKFSLRLVAAQSDAEREHAREQLLAAIDLMERSHDALTHGDESMQISSERSAAVESMYFGDDGLDAKVQSYLFHAKQIAQKPAPTAADPDIRTVVAMAEKPLLASLNAAVERYENEGAALVSRMQTIELAITLATLVLLVLEGFVIFRPMVRQLRAKIDKILAQSERLRTRDEAMQLVLDSTGDGLVSVTPQGQLLPERSSVVHTWFGEPDAGATLWGWLYAEGSADEALMMELGFEQVADGLMPLEVTLSMMPGRIERDGRVYELRFRPTGDEDDATQPILVVIADVTAQLQRERAERETKEVIAVVRRMMEDQRAFWTFLDEAKALVESLEGLIGDETTLLRVLHTIKGNVGVYGMGMLAEVAHDAESAVLNGGVEAHRPAVAKVKAGWDANLARLEAFVTDDANRGVIELLPAEFESHMVLLRSRPEYGTLVPVVTRWADEPARRSANGLLRLAEGVAHRQGKRVETTLHGGDVRLPRERFGELWHAMVHVLRNAVDHGIESPSERSDAGKSETGSIEMFVEEVSGSRVRIQVRDDGRGVDWDRIRAKAEAAGLAFGTQAERTRALFADGISSRDEVTALSGRGVGTSAVLEAVEALGGTLSLDTTRGEGTTLEIVAPLHRSTPQTKAA